MSLSAGNTQIATAENTQATATVPTPQANTGIGRRVAVLAALLAAWFAVYAGLAGAAKWLTYDLLRFGRDTHLGSSVEFFIYEVPKVLMLLVLVVFVVGIVRTFFAPERTRRILAGKRESLGNVLAALLGIVTPFCSCSAVPLFIGFVESGVPLGVTFSFLIAAPMINEVAAVLLFGMFGWRVAAIYVGTGLVIAMVAGWVIGRLRMERHVEPWVYEVKVGASGLDDHMSWSDRIDAGWQAVREIVRKVWPFLVAGIAVGAGIHGFVPTGAMAQFMGKGAPWWTLPLVVLAGVPMYSNAAGMIPVVHALLEKGAALGTTLAFMMAVIAISLPEMIILRRVLRPRLIAVFVGVVWAGIMVVGYLFNAIF